MPESGPCSKCGARASHTVQARAVSSQGRRKVSHRMKRTSIGVGSDKRTVRGCGGACGWAEAPVPKPARTSAIISHTFCITMDATVTISSKAGLPDFAPISATSGRLLSVRGTRPLIGLMQERILGHPIIIAKPEVVVHRLGSGFQPLVPAHDSCHLHDDVFDGLQYGRCRAEIQDEESQGMSP